MALIREGPQGPPGEPGRSHSLSGHSWNSLCSDAPAVPTDSEDEGGRQIDEGGAEPSGRRPELTAPTPTARQKLLGRNRSELVLNVWECVAETNVLFYFFLFASPSSLPSPHFFFSFSGRQGFGGVGGGWLSFSAGSGGEAEAAALHADLQAVGGLAAGVDDAAVHVAGQVAVAALLRHAAAAEARVVAHARAAGGTVQHDVAQGEELAEEAGQDTVNAAVVLRLGGDLRAVALGAALAPLAALGGDGRVGLQLLAVPGPSRGRRRGGRAALRQGAQLRVRAPVPHAVGLRAVRVRRVVRAVCVRQARVWVVVVVLLGSVAHLLAAGLRPTRLGGVDGRRPGNRLRDDGLARRGELGVHKAAVPPLAVVAPQPLRGAVYPQYEGLSVGEGLVWTGTGLLAGTSVCCLCGGCRVWVGRRWSCWSRVPVIRRLRGDGQGAPLLVHGSRGRRRRSEPSVWLGRGAAEKLRG